MRTDPHPTHFNLEQALAILMRTAVNHETGIVQPVAEVVRRAHAAGAKVHLDAVQGWGKIAVPSGWDTASSIA